MFHNKCSYGLLFNNKNNTLDKYCLENCCIPCPIQNYFYKNYNIERDFKIINVLRVASTILSLYILITYIFKLINKKTSNLERKYISIVTYLSFSIFLFSSVSLFVIQDPKKIQCKDEITKSTQTNNTLCSVQGALLIFSSFSIVISVFMLVLDFHIEKILKKEIMSKKYVNSGLWIIPFIATFIVLLTNNISYEFSNLCLISLDYIYYMFFYPLGSIIFLSSLLLLISLTKISYDYAYTSYNIFFYNNTRDDSQSIEMRELDLKKIKLVLKDNWRYISISFISSFTISFYWIFYYNEINKFKTIFSDFSFCMIDTTPEHCFVELFNKIPKYTMLIISETLVSIVGLWLFLVFFEFDKCSIFIEKSVIFKRKNKNKNTLLEYL